MHLRQTSKLLQVEVEVVVGVEVGLIVVRLLHAARLSVADTQRQQQQRKGEGKGKGKQRHCIFPAAIVFLIKRCHMLRVSLLSQCLIADNAQGAEAKRSHHKASQAKAACQLSPPPPPHLPPSPWFSSLIYCRWERLSFEI